MAVWSAENATKAYLKTLKMGERAKEPNMAEFVSALAAGNNAQLMVVACAGSATSTTLALLAAAHQTGGRVVCILRGKEELRLSETLDLGHDIRRVEFVIGDPRDLISTHFKAADFVLIDCNLENQEGILRSVEENCRRRSNGAVVVGYNAFSGGSWRSGAGGARTQLLPIGNGLLVSRITGGGSVDLGNRKSRWIVRVDKCTGEEHVFRIKFPQAKEIQA